MTRTSLLFLVLTGLLIGGCQRPEPATEPPPAAVSLVIDNVTIVDTRTGQTRPRMTVWISDDRISKISPAAAVDAGIPVEDRLDGNGAFLIPGLWDLHVHTLWDPIVRETFLPTFVANGVTGVRDMGGDLKVLEDIRAAAKNGDLVTPRIFAPGPILDGPEPVIPSISWPIANEADARQAIDRLASAGVDFVKIYTTLPREAFLAVIDQAARAGLDVAGHVPANIGAEAAARAGMRSLEHMQAETGGFCSRTEPDTCSRLFALFRQHQTWQTPTLTVRRARATVAAESLAEDPRLTYIPASLREEWLDSRQRKLATRSPEYFAALAEEHANELWLAGELHRREVPLLAGSDAGADFVYPGFGLHDELELLNEVGLSPFEALRAATLDAAVFLRQSDLYGTVEAGKVADLVLLDGNPLEDIRNTRRVRAVVLDGRLFARQDLDQLLEQAAEASH